MGRVELFHSRRTKYHLCEFWIRDERNSTGNPSQWILYNAPSGKFYASTIAPQSNQANIINGVWMVDKNHATIESEEDLHDLTRGSIVKYKNKLWIVLDVQLEEHVKESEFCIESDYKYIISLECH